ncbi:MAG: alkaline phosphatase family protein [Kofleriaceae bacterium]|nr:alkaline phosphatase family protein [Kofleriaceae bacterium]
MLSSLGAVQAGKAGKDFTTDLDLKTPALAKAPPIVLSVETPRLSRRVFVVIVDGLRADRSYELPFLDELRRDGLDLEARSHYPTWSRPNYVSILAGVTPMASGVRTNYHVTPVGLDSLMDRARAAGMHTATATDYAMLPELFRAPDLPVRSAFDDARYTPWPGGFVEAGRDLVASNAELVVMLLSPVDITGHERGADAPEYRAATERADRALAKVLGDVDLSLDTIVVVADHGHTGPGGHGGVEPEVLAVPLVMAGAGIAREATIHDARLIDIAPTVAALLGLPAPGHGLGATLVDALALTPAQRTARVAADRQRLSITESTVALAEARAELAQLDDRALRLGIVASGAAIAIMVAVLLLRRRAMRLDLRVLSVSVPAFFGIYFVLIGTIGQRFSPSLVPAQGDIARAMLPYAAIGMVAQLAASLWALRSHRTLAARLAAANGIAWVCLVLTMVPAGLLWAYFPPPYVVVPSPFWLVVIPAVQVAVAGTAINVALMLVIEVIVFAARAWQRPA